MIFAYWYISQGNTLPKVNCCRLENCFSSLEEADIFFHYYIQISSEAQPVFCPMGIRYLSLKTMMPEHEADH
jgi:hypothetical protein